MKDFYGRELYVGDIVAFQYCNSRMKSIYLGKIIRITSNRVILHYWVPCGEGPKGTGFINNDRAISPKYVILIAGPSINRRSNELEKLLDDFDQLINDTEVWQKKI